MTIETYTSLAAKAGHFDTVNIDNRSDLEIPRNVTTLFRCNVTT
jgi:hypothetical protein